MPLERNKGPFCIINYRHRQFKEGDITQEMTGVKMEIIFFRSIGLLKSKNRLSRKEIVFSTVNFPFSLKKKPVKK